ncbi:MAG: omega-3 polyunsaturated fatty acid synthase subunit, PfaC [uncultured Aureispira sp.]|uniref:Omega-3 polyunsaturated fatty acid synthase subunit, PfaC n=1 Tax=uncultured Aureispira sp. TaxID=1331704 RepID=A0A6S6S699_9BACT|nr:MAG: omega-3 polyunsaturated fatty acid synthase subunit, PfaC [uncultured Aureispira sp.]
MKIAIIGMSGLFPGSSTNKEFWENLVGEKNLIKMATEEDFGVSPDTFFQSDKGVVDKCYSLRGGYIRNFEFDPTGYKLPSDFVAKQDKLYQWSLYVAKEALKDSGYYDSKTALEKCGLVLGNLSFPTGSSHKLMSSVYTQTTEKALQELLEDDNFKIESHKYEQPDNEVLCDTPSKMVCKALGLGGNHYALDAACATSLYAIKLACDDLMTGKSDLMLAGAVCASDQLFIHMGFSIFHAYAPHDEKFAPLDSNSGGLVSSEGAGIVVLKRLDDAQWDGDKILGVIGGIGLSNDGRGKFLLSPNPKGQKLAFERAYLKDDVLPKNTSYLECHATGTPLGDVTEMNSISDFFQQHHAAPLLGSVKSNMGHLLTAAGMTGLFKVLLSMEKGFIPPNVNLTEAVQTENQFIKDEHIITRATPWKGNQAGINSFGFGGTNAHMVIQAYEKEKPAAYKLLSMEAMSIVGMEAYFGDCTNLDDFYASIYNGKQHFRALPAERWKGFDANEALLKEYGFKNGKAPKGAYIDRFEIDLLRYKIQPKEAETLEPQQALILSVADKALQDAGIDESQNIAVLIAMESELAIHHYLSRWDSVWQIEEAIERSNIILTEEKKKELKEQCKNALYFREGGQTPSQHTSFVGNIMASRIAALWDFSGPAFTVSCGENSVFKALEVAQNMLSLGEVDAVVVGGVDFCGGLESVLLRNQKNPASTVPNPSLSLNQNDAGWLVGEGAGAIVLKRSKEAKKDKIYATIDHIGKAKTELNIGYQELVASGVAAQDTQEIAQLLKTKQEQEVALGSVKTSIGNTCAASGIASLIKTALCLHHRFIPGIPNWKAPKLAEEFAGTNYYFPAKSRPWLLSNNQEKRRAAINGLDGLQIQLTESPVYQEKETPLTNGRVTNIILIKGNSETALNTQIQVLEKALLEGKALSQIAAQSYASTKQQKYTYCISILARNKKAFAQELKFIKLGLPNAILEKKEIKTPKGSYFTGNPLGTKGKVAFVYPGSAAAYNGLGQDIFQLFPQLHTHFEEKVPNMSEFVGTQYLHPKTQTADTATPNIHKDAIAMMSAGVFSSAIYTHILRAYFKLEPQIAFGYSMGESASMWYSLNVWSPTRTSVFKNSSLFQNEFSGDLNLLAKVWDTTSEEAKERWVSLILLAPRAKVEALVARYDKTYLSFVNTNNEVIISGEKATCLSIVSQLNCHSIEVPFQNVIHHDFCKMAHDDLMEMHEFSLEEKPNIDFYSSLTLEKLPFDSNIIARNSSKICYQAVDFPRTVETIYDKGARIFIELGANATCTSWIKENLATKEHLAISMNKKGKSDAQNILEAMAQLLSHGVALDLDILYKNILLEAEPRSFKKEIITGGKRIFDVLLSETNKASFANLQRKAIAKEPTLAVVDSETNLVATRLESSNTKQKNISIARAQQLSETQKSIVTLETKTVETMHNKTSNPTIGENGLLLQDFASGAQLKGKTIIFSQEDLQEFAEGKIGKVFGPDYDIIDSYSRRVMLPMDPYLLVSRVTGLNAKKGEYKPSTMQTEYDIPYNAWFTTDGQIPWAVSVESGQCDLLLISYLGIDFENKGDLVYRLLDCTLTFVDDLPFEGQTLRYDISINSFVKNGDNLLFFFSYDCYVEDRLVLKMRGGCAGFFTDEQLEEGLGLIYTKEELQAKVNVKKPKFTPLLNTTKTSFSKEDLHHLIDGNIEKCFGNISYYANGRNQSLCLPSEQILMLDRITSVDLQGGAYGLGYIVAEKDLSPNDWYFPCHFRDDEVLAGSLQAEGGGNLLRFLMLMLGLQRLTKDARYQPIYDLPQKVRCRKQVVPGKDTKLVYKLEVKEIGLVPNPYIIADLEIISDGVITVHFENLGLQLREKDNPKYLEQEAGVKISPRSEGALLNELDITNFALSDLSKAFGPDFSCYDGRTVSRQPNTDLQLISRVLKIEGERLYFKKPSTIYAEYDVPVDAWYYEQNSTKTMPYSVLMEIALQPCGLLGAYMGSTLKFSDKNLFFRNLDGDGEMFDLPMGTDWRGKTIHNKSVLVSSVSLAGTVLQNYTFELSIDGQVFYKGKSSFGFFPGEALAQQVGLDNGTDVPAWYQSQNLQAKDYLSINLDSLYGKMKLFKAPADKPHYHLAGDQLLLLDQLKIVKDGGKYSKGYVHASKIVNTYDWFFTCHFYQDPVMPGSLGVEAILQAMQTFALQQNLGKDFKSPKFVQLDHHKTSWKYRGQILLGVENMHCEVHFKTIEKRGNTLAIIGDAFLWNEGTRIYQVTDLALGIVEA